MKRTAIAAALIGSLGVSAVASDSSANWQTFRYGPRAQFDLTCSAGAICEVALARGEVLNGGQFVGDTEGSVELWQHSSFLEGVQVGRTTETRPHLTFVPARGGMQASAIIGTSQHIYRFRLISVDGNRPTYAGFVYPSTIATPRPSPSAPPHPAAFRTHYVSFYRPQPVATPQPQDVAAQMARACAAMAPTDIYASDPQPAEWRPARVCHSAARTFIQLQSSDTVPTDIAIPREVTPQGDADMIWAYDSRSRIYGVDLVPNEIVLTLGTGKHQMRMLIQRQQKNALPTPTAAPSPDSTIVLRRAQ